ncbi:hypothetical protein [Aquimarina algiphila]|uniref:hypothetical protein n=1 Tax=Aquimarina algiphila TaxID=2047982 RepID=UPI00232E6B07|nr:hypothetical protein [Aquimarina algiphila]
MDLIIGQYYDNIKCEFFLDKETNRVRVRPLPNQLVPTTMVIECLKKLREENKVDTHFLTENVKVCKKPDVGVYLREKGQVIQ